ncbi:insulinase family protein [Flavivirga abyssicola]|uniref:M16 family metallopeptidase n=1 Tax=Flavivirga abyssicola TaxID=3063533 RepID=UPI0026DEB2AA|nr:M16 family metallopeptidase [Flavivirga sp. MEBiC07777]WVK12014.1 insulinase family protein [Flavivirga sp. MEBiC07777]
MKYLFLKGFLLLLTLSVYSQGLDLKEQLPKNKKIKKGVLPNGLTYYIYSTDNKKGKADYYLIQNVGSILENEDQRGLAHFLEHMTFNGSTSFPNNEILRVLEKNGLNFGNDINATTRYDQTINYIKNLGVASKKIDLALLVLYNMAHELTLSDEDIDKERGVVKEEWRSGDYASAAKTSNLQASVTYAGSKYKDRSPIGLMSVIDNFKYETLRNFYRDWYRPDLQAIAVVGDIDIDDVEKRIIKTFSKIPKPENPKKRYEVAFKNNEQPLFILTKDKDDAISKIEFYIHKAIETDKNTIGGLRKSLLDKMLVNMLSKRFNTIIDFNSPMFSVKPNISKAGRLNNDFGIQISPKQNMQEEAFSLTMNELNRAIKFGFTPSEFEKAKTDIKNNYKTIIKDLKTKDILFITNQIKKDYLNNIVATDTHEEYEIAKNILNEVTPKELTERLRSLYTTHNRRIIVTGTIDEKNLSKKKALKIIEAAEKNNKLTPYKEKKEDIRSLMHGTTLVPGKIVKQLKNNDLDFTTYTLSNSIRVHHKYTDNDDEKIYFSAISQGGISLLDKEDLLAGKLLFKVIKKSGLGAFNAKELKEKLTGKQIRLDYALSNYQESIRCSFNKNDAKEALQMMHLTFSSPRFDVSAFKNIIEKEKTLRKKNENIIFSKVRRNVNDILYGKNNPLFQSLRIDNLESITLDKVKKVYYDRFENPADFDFIIVGKITKETLKPLLEKYLGSLSTTSRLEKFKKNEYNEWTASHIDEDVYIPMTTPQAYVDIKLKKQISFNAKETLASYILAQLLRLSYTNLLREKEGGIYGIDIGLDLIDEQKEDLNTKEANLRVNFKCNPNLVDKLVKIVYEELDRFKNGKISQENFNNIKQSFISYYTEESLKKETKKSNSSSLIEIKNFIDNGGKLEPGTSAKEKLEAMTSLTIEDVQEMTKKLLDNPKSSKIIVKPLKE